MRKLYLMAIVAFLCLLGVVACQEERLEPVLEEEVVTEPFTVHPLTGSKHENKANSFKELLKNTRSNKNERISDWDLDWSTAKITINHITGVEIFAIPLENGLGDGSFDNLLIRDTNGEIGVSRIRFMPNQQWYENGAPIESFSGQMHPVSLDGEGESPQENGRTMATCNECICDEGDYIEINMGVCESGDTKTFVTIDDGGGGGDGSGDGGGTGGGDSGGGGDTGGGDGSGDPDYPVGGGGASGGSGGGDSGDTGGSDSGSDDGDDGNTEDCLLDADGNCIDVVEPVIKKPSAAKIWEANNVELDSSFSENPCAMEVYDSLIKTGVFSGILQGFSSSLDLELVLEVGDLTNPTTGNISYGRTDYDTINNIATITIEQTMLGNSTQLGIAAIILHELLHAEMMRATLEGDTLNIGDPHTLAELKDSLASFIFEPMHATMISLYRDDLKNALHQFAGIPLSTDVDLDEEINHASWGGLLRPARFNDLISFTEYREAQDGLYGIPKGADNAIIRNGIHGKLCD